MRVRIVADSSADLLELDGVDFASVPLTVTVGERDFVDDAALDVDDMVATLAAYQGRTTTACPSIEAWLQAFDNADVVYVVTITSGLSGTYNSAMTARELYLQQKPDAKVYVVDSLSTGPEMRLIVEKLAELNNQGMEFEDVCREIRAYQKRTRLFFSLESLHNLVQNGRVSKLVASVVGVLGIRIFGTASEQGTLETLAKCRNTRKVISNLLEQLKKAGYKGGKLCIAHVGNLPFAEEISRAVRETFGTVSVAIYRSRGLCSYYAETGGVLIGCECAE